MVARARLRLRAAPEPPSTLAAYFPTLAAVGQAVAAVTMAGIVPALLELMDWPTVIAVDEHTDRGLDRDAVVLLLAQTDTPAGQAEREMTIPGRCATPTVPATSPAPPTPTKGRTAAHRPQARLPGARNSAVPRRWTTWRSPIHASPTCSGPSRRSRNNTRWRSPRSGTSAMGTCIPRVRRWRPGQPAGRSYAFEGILDATLRLGCRRP